MSYERFNSSNHNIRYALTKYTKEQYNRFGWVRANDIVNKGYWKNFTRNFADAINKKNFNRITPEGEYMIEVYDGDLAEHLQVIDHIIYAKGTINKPTITRVLKIDEYNETELSEIRSDLYAIERIGIRQKTFGIFTLYDRSDIQSYEDAKRNIQERSRYNNQLGTERGGSGATAQETDSRLRSPYTPLVETFVDVSGKEHNILKVNSQYIIEGDKYGKLKPTVEAVIESKNNRLINNYARKYERTPNWVRQMLTENPDFLKKERKKGKRFALAKVDSKTVSKHKKDALEHFGTTYDYDQAGFVVDDGRMLKLSMYGLKGVRHRRIGEIFDDLSGYEAINQFIQAGNLTETKKTEVVKTPALQMQTPEASRSVIYSIAQIIEFVNSGDLLRYIPDEMLTETQKQTKGDAISETIRTTDGKN